MAALPYTEIGVHVPEAISEIRSAIADPRSSSGTRILNLGVCALAAFDDEPEGFGAAGAPGMNIAFWLAAIQFAMDLIRRRRSEGFGASEDDVTDEQLKAQGEAVLALAE